MVLIGVVTSFAVVSVVRGLDGGIKVLSGVNMTLALVLLVAVVAIGPTGEILVTAARGALAYGANLVPLAIPFGREDTGFSHDWTTFYWAWWVSWSPFVGMFIARVSRGRTVREFVVCVTLIPTLAPGRWQGRARRSAGDDRLDGPSVHPGAAGHVLLHLGRPLGRGAGEEGRLTGAVESFLRGPWPS